MATYAVMEGNVVANIVVSEDVGFFQIAYPDSVVIEQTEETGPANVGVEFRSGRFVPIKPWSSWVFDEQTWAWVAPVAYPSDEKSYFWNETDQSWEYASLVLPTPEEEPNA
jgi:hypothetical protein